jgi:hypothetical protein
MAGSTRAGFAVDTPEDMAEMLRTMREELDELKGLRGTIVIHDVIENEAGLTIKDINGTILHQFGSSDI